MSNNQSELDFFKKSLSITTKSIGKCQKAEVNFVRENPSIDGRIINLTLPKLNSISYRPTNRILEFWGANGERPKIECYEEDFINAKINRNKLIIKDIEGREHEVEPICLKNVLDNSEVI